MNKNVYASRGAAGRRASLVEAVSRRASFIEQLNKEFAGWQETTFGNVNKRQNSFKREYDVEENSLRAFMCKVVESKTFQTIIITTIFVNAITIAIETQSSMTKNYAIEVLDLIYLGIYFWEFIFKFYAERMSFWQSGANCFDFSILLIALVSFVQSFVGEFGADDIALLRVFRALRALRALRSISFVRPLQVIVVAIVRTMQSVINLLSLLLLIMLIFAIMGYYFFGRPDDTHENFIYFETLGQGLHSLWCYVTVDGWMDLLGYDASMDRKIFSMSFILLGHFIFTNLFIGVVIQNLEEAQEEERVTQDVRKLFLFHKKKDFILEKQDQDLNKLLEKNNLVGGDNSIQDKLGKLAGQLRHSDLVPMTHLACQPLWMEYYLATCNFQEQNMYALQQLHFAIANNLSEALERHLQEMTVLKSSHRY